MLDLDKLLSGIALKEEFILKLGKGSNQSFYDWDTFK